MRMWMVRPGLLCDAHLIREHDDLHELVEELRGGMLGRARELIKSGLIDLQEAMPRHDNLMREIQKRGLLHDGGSPCLSDRSLDQDYDALMKAHRAIGLSGLVDLRRSVDDLCSSCCLCRQRIEGDGK